MSTVEAGQTYIVAETGKFFHVHSLHDDYCVIGELTTFYTDAKTNRSRVQVSWDFVEAAVLITAIDKVPGAFHNGIGWTHRMSEPDPEHPKMYRL